MGCFDYAQTGQTETVNDNKFLKPYRELCSQMIEHAVNELKSPHAETRRQAKKFLFGPSIEHWATAVNLRINIHWLRREIKKKFGESSGA